MNYTADQIKAIADQMPPALAEKFTADMMTAIVREQIKAEAQAWINSQIPTLTDKVA